MKNKLGFSVCLLIPLILFITSNSLKDDQGPYFTNYQYDPSYVYLISSLNLSQFSAVKHIDHPGTPLQLIGAVVIQLSYLFNSQYDSLSQDVLNNPEKYLNKIDYTLLIVNCLGLFLLGVISYKVYSDVLLSLLLQLTPFTSVNILSSLTLVRTENFLFFVVCIFIAGLILVVNDQNINKRKYPGHLILLGVVSGLGLATKLTFFPLIVIPLILFPGIRSKLLFLLILLLSFILFVLPVMSIQNINFFINWIYKLFVHSDLYGKGDSTIVEPHSFLLNIKEIVTNEWIFDIAYLSVGISMIYCLKRNIKSTLMKLALGIFLAMTVQILVVSKHYAPHYMFPSLMISVFAILTSVNILSNASVNLFPKKRSSIIYLILIFSITIYGIMFINKYGNQLRISAEESEKLTNYVDSNSQNAVIVSTKLVSSRETALFAGITYAKNEVKNYKLILNDRYPRSIIYYNNRCYSFGDDDTIENIFKPADKILFVCTEENSLNHFLELLRNLYHIEDITFDKKFSNKNGEIVYEINFRHS